jgi:hypothetical protein
MEKSWRKNTKGGTKGKFSPNIKGLQLIYKNDVPIL